MAEKSWNGLEERPRWMTDDARLRERNSDAGAVAGMGFEATRVTCRVFTEGIDGGRIVETD